MRGKCENILAVRRNWIFWVNFFRYWNPGWGQGLLKQLAIRKFQMLWRTNFASKSALIQSYLNFFAAATTNFGNFEKISQRFRFPIGNNMKIYFDHFGFEKVWILFRRNFINYDFEHELIYELLFFYDSSHQTCFNQFRYFHPN